MIMKKLLLLGLALTLTACAGRDPKPIPLRSQLDGTMTCDALALEKQANQSLLAHLAEEENNETAYNLVVTGLALAVVTPVALALDFSNAETVETNSLIKRNKRIDALRVTRGCVLEDQAPEGYNSFTRSEMAYSDGSGRQMMLTSNRYTYDPSGQLVPVARPQYGHAEELSLY